MEPTLTTLILKTAGLTIGADYVNQAARKHVEQALESHNDALLSHEVNESARNEFERVLEHWSYFFEVDYKRDLKRSREEGLLEKIGHLTVPGLMEITERSSHDLACRAERLLKEMLDEMKDPWSPNVSSLSSLYFTQCSLLSQWILCLGGYSQSRELRTRLNAVSPRPIFELGGSE